MEDILFTADEVMVFLDVKRMHEGAKANYPGSEKPIAIVLKKRAAECYWSFMQKYKGIEKMRTGADVDILSYFDNTTIKALEI